MIATEQVLLYILSFCCFLYYLKETANRPIKPLAIGAKVLSILALVGLAILGKAPVEITAALAFSAVGDYFLGRDRGADFLKGLSAFALSHILFLVAFLNLGADLAHGDVFKTLPLIVFLFVTLWLILPRTGSLKLPVAIYIGLIFGMAYAAIGLPQVNALTLLGVSFFVISDFLLGFARFRPPSSAQVARFLARALWLFYWLGQSLILIGIIHQ